MNVPQLNVALHRGRPLSALVLNVNLGYLPTHSAPFTRAWFRRSSVHTRSISLKIAMSAGLPLAMSGARDPAMPAAMPMKVTEKNT